MRFRVLVVQVVRCFEDGNVVHVSGKVDPADDVETINLELGLRDLQQIEQKLERNAKSRVKGSPAETEALEKAAAVLNDGFPLRSADLTPEEVCVDQADALSLSSFLLWTGWLTD